MGVFNFFRRSEKQDVTGSEPFWRKIFGGSGQVEKAVSAMQAMQTSAFYACVKLIAETVGALPFPVLKLTPDGKTRAFDFPLYKLLNDKPNPEQIAIQFREMVTANLLVHGDGYAEIEFDDNGQPVALWPLPTWCVDPVRTTTGVRGELYYQVTIPQTGQQFQMPPYRILRIPGFAMEGDKGLSPLAMARRALNLSQAAESFGYDFFANGTNVGAVVSTDKALTDKAFDRLRTDLRDKYEGLGKSHRLMLLEEGLKFEKNTIPPNDAQFLETRKFQLTDIARIFRVPPHMVGDLERATFSNIEQQDLFFVKHTILPYLRRWEQAVHNTCIPEELQHVYYAEHNVEGLLRGDVASRYKSYSIGRQWGWLSVNDIRFLENLNKVEDGDEYLKPLNMVPLGADTTPSANNGEGGDGSET
ncbi:phage portal protein [Paenibacillus oryzisoli]|uniref:Phage portal protein n=1 Tax=Paenibacillus oryzisoli TaxID=1850517 RepID=A0A198AJB8_9BACL|nr:phage portal protein [Paenibacillus oryzisoli]OAS21146.1 phage portal protein [Paenibacillus oryzisoli]